jgi:putative oxidoreductase
VLQQKEDIALLFARLFIASMFLPSGLEKLITFPKFSGSLGSKGLPYPEVWAVLTMAIEVLGPIALIAGAWSQWTAVALIVVTLFTTWTTYKSAMFSLSFRNPQHPHFFKNVAVMAGLLLYFVSGPGAFSWRRGGQG